MAAKVPRTWSPIHASYPVLRRPRTSWLVAQQGGDDEESFDILDSLLGDGPAPPSEPPSPVVAPPSSPPPKPAKSSSAGSNKKLRDTFIEAGRKISPAPPPPAALPPPAESTYEPFIPVVPPRTEQGDTDEALLAGLSAAAASGVGDVGELLTNLLDGVEEATAAPAAPAAPPPVASAPAASSQAEAPAEPAAESAARSASTGRSPLLHDPLVQIVLCAAGYLGHVCVLSRRTCSLGGLSLGWDTIAGLGVLAAAAAKRVRLQKAPVPPWLTGSACEDAAEMADFSTETGGERRRLLATVALLLAAPLGFSFCAPAIEGLVSVLVLLGAPLTRARTLSVRLMLEQSILNLGGTPFDHRRRPWLTADTLA